jgi:EAL domain-containing protein (putative c-di-GMP-specific phosphodiesterase class I)
MPAPPSALPQQRSLDAEAPGPPESGWVESEIVPYFQPIVDLTALSVLGYEVLSRSPRFERISEAFELARRTGMAWDLELTCRERAIARLAQLTGHVRGARFFLNVGPAVLADPRFIAGFTSATLTKQGIAAEQIVLEVTEQQAVASYARFGELVRHYLAEGFQISLGDFGSGHSSLMKLVNCAPQFVKLDRDLVRGIQHDAYRQRVIHSLVDFAANVDARLIAEGVEEWAELEILVQLGVSLAQGHLFGRPDAEPPILSEEFVTDLERLVRRHRDAAARPDHSGAFTRQGVRSPAGK